MRGESGLVHRGMGAERDHDAQPRDPSGHGPVHRRQQQREGAAPGAVGHDDAEALPVEVDRIELLADERADLLVGENLARSPDQRHGLMIGR